MANSNPVLTPAYVLHSRSYRDTSSIVEFFTEEFGVLAAVAKGARNPRSSWRGILMSGTPLLISCVGRQELLTLTHAEIQGTPLLLQGPALFSLFYLNELLLYLLQRSDPYPSLYHYYVQTITKLNESTSLEPILRLFEWKLLQELGYGLHIEIDKTKADAIQAESYYQVINQQKIIPSSPPYTGTVYQGHTLLALSTAQFPADPRILREAKYLLRYLLTPLLGNKEIKSRALFT